MDTAQDTLTALCDATVFTGDSMEENHALVMKAGKIVDIVASARIPADARKVSCAGYILSPGYIDAQVNGGGNVLFNNAPTVEACKTIAQAHRNYGTTRLLITCITDTPEVTQKAVTAMRTARAKDKSVLGIHIEGPHLGVERRGVHKPEFIRDITDSDMDLYKREDDEIMMMTIAPENVTPGQIEALRAQGVIVSIGHTNATAEEIHAALKAGATGFTHLFNGMGKPNAAGRVPADMALEDPGSWCSLIADGYHVSAELIQLALRTKPKGKIFFVSDAMPPAATDKPKPFRLYDETIRVEKGRCVNNEGKLAGSSVTMADAVRHCVKIGIDTAEALRMATLYPAEFLGINGTFGRLAPGFEADILALDLSLKPAKIWVGGTALT